MLGHSWGVVLVVIAGVAVFAIGAGMVVYGIKRKFEAKLKLAQASWSVRQGVVRLGQVGYIARGVAFGIVGALRELAGKPLGGVLLTVVAIGFAAFGVYCFFQAKYRKI